MGMRSTCLSYHYQRPLFHQAEQLNPLTGGYNANGDLHIQTKAVQVWTQPYCEINFIWWGSVIWLCFSSLNMDSKLTRLERQRPQPLSWYETKQAHCVKSKPRFSSTGHEDKTAVRLMSGYDSLPAVCNCCSTLVNPDKGEEKWGEQSSGEMKINHQNRREKRREDKRRHEKRRVRTQECWQLPNDLK